MSARLGLRRLWSVRRVTDATRVSPQIKRVLQQHAARVDPFEFQAVQSESSKTACWVRRFAKADCSAVCRLRIEWAARPIRGEAHKNKNKSIRVDWVPETRVQAQCKDKKSPQKIINQQTSKLTKPSQSKNKLAAGPSLHKHVSSFFGLSSSLLHFPMHLSSSSNRLFA